MRRLLAVGIVTFVLALAPRTIATERFVTADEGAFWFVRSFKFERALLWGKPEETWQAPHPGVTTMWAGAAGRQVYRGTVGRPHPRPLDQYERVLPRRFVALLTSICVGIASAIAASRWGVVTGLTFGALLAFEPFLVAHSRILHTDALATMFLLVAALGAWVARRPRHWDGVAIAAALAGLSKLPGFFVVPVALALLGWRTKERGAVATVGAFTRFGIVGTATVLLVWPATWAAPQAILDGLGSGVELGTAAHETGNYFFGAIIDDPGPFFYPVALLFRLSPVVLVGVLLAAWAARRERPADVRRSDLAYLVVVAAVVLAPLTLSAKKFDRYALPVLPLLDLIAALGWVGVGRVLWARGPRLAYAGATLLAVATVAPVLSIHPYEMSWYNPLVGGAATARDNMLVGWGEGLEQVGDHLTRIEPDCTKVVRSLYPHSLEAFMCHTIADVAENPDYIVLYANQVQRHPELLAEVAGRAPAFIARAPSGLELAWLYRAE